MRTITMPPEPWDLNPCRAPGDTLAKAPPHIRKLITSAFEGTVDERDLKYMARALLQMSDEIFELRERIAGIEMAMKAMKS